MVRHRLLWLALFLGVVSILVLALTLQESSWASSERVPGRDTVPTRVPELTPVGYLPVVLKNAGAQQRFVSKVPQILPRQLPDYKELIEAGPSGNLVNSADKSLNCRYGIATWSPQTNWLSEFGAGAYLDFHAHTPQATVSAEFIQVIHVTQDKDGCTYLPSYTISPQLTDNKLGALVDAHPGSLWLVGNEPDRGPNPGSCTGGQDDTFPEVYAEAYHDVYHFIKQRDPTAQVAIAGLVEVTPGRLQYLDKVWQAYLDTYGTTMPVDVWNMHIYVLPEATPDGQPDGVASVALGTDPALAIRQSGWDPAKCADPQVYCWAEHDSMFVFVEQVRAMRIWMKQHGQQNKPLLLSEYSILYTFEDYDDPVNPTTCWLQDEYGKCFTPARVSKFMTQTFNYLETAADPNLGFPPDQNRLVQQWVWFSMYFDGGGAGVGYVSNLLNDDEASLTAIGQLFSSTVNSIPTYVNLLPADVAHPAAFLTSLTDTVTVTISANIYNNGNTQTTDPVVVTFYSDAALTQVIGSVTLPTPVGGCARQAVTAAVAWADLPAGVHQYWVKVDGDLSFQDNVAQGYALVSSIRVFLPVLLRLW